MKGGGERKGKREEIQARILKCCAFSSFLNAGN